MFLLNKDIWDQSLKSRISKYEYLLKVTNHSVRRHKIKQHLKLLKNHLSKGVETR
jgi:hypothetical protein